LEGTFLHERADTPGVENRPGVRVTRALPLFSRRWGLVGKADIVEFHRRPEGGETPLPVDYKRGPRRRWDNDDAQLCAQALCLEEMMGVPVPMGAIFHAASKRRRDVEFTPALRDMTAQAIEQIRALLAAGRVPPAELKPRCDGCSLRDICVPELADSSTHVSSVREGLYEVRDERSD
jgi:CRISPR-associated exonuclease Cas4